MGFNKVILQEPRTLLAEYKAKGLRQFISRYSNYDAIMGPSESVTFLNTIFDFKDESSEEVISDFVKAFETELEAQ